MANGGPEGDSMMPTEFDTLRADFRQQITDVREDIHRGFESIRASMDRLSADVSAQGKAIAVLEASRSVMNQLGLEVSGQGKALAVLSADNARLKDMVQSLDNKAVTFSSKDEADTFASEIRKALDKANDRANEHDRAIAGFRMSGSILGALAGLLGGAIASAIIAKLVG